MPLTPRSSPFGVFLWQARLPCDGPPQKHACYQHHHGPTCGQLNHPPPTVSLQQTRMQFACPSGKSVGLFQLTQHLGVVGIDIDHRGLGRYTEVGSQKLSFAFRFWRTPTMTGMATTFGLVLHGCRNRNTHTVIGLIGWNDRMQSPAFWHNGLRCCHSIVQRTGLRLRHHCV